jgi:large subunit ribosomal protein L32
MFIFGISDLTIAEVTMPLPKRRHSNTRSQKRRTFYKITAVAVGECTHCGEPVPSHTVCPSCGYYGGNPILQIKTKKDKTKKK